MKDPCKLQSLAHDLVCLSQTRLLSFSMCIFFGLGTALRSQKHNCWKCTFMCSVSAPASSTLEKVPKLDKVISSEIYKVGTAMQLTPLWPIHQQTQGQSSDQHGNCRSTSHLIVWIKRDPWMDLWEVFQICLRSKEHVSSLESQAGELTWPLSMSKM